MRIAAFWIWMPYNYVTTCRSNLLYFYTQDVDINFFETHARTHAHIYAVYPSKFKHSNGPTPHNNTSTDPTAGRGAVQNIKVKLRGLNPDSADVLPIKQQI
jgi:hypothetical protein